MPRLNSNLAYPYNLIENAMELNRRIKLEWYDLPSDIYESVEYVLKMLKKQQREFVEMRYKMYMTYQDIADIHNLSRERVRQVINFALRQLSHPQRWRYVKYGICKVEKMSKLDKIIIRSDECDKAF